jgi:membrane protease YdiL (CAAX protease family)
MVTYLITYMRWSRLNPGTLIREHWVPGVIGGAVVGAFGVWTVLHQPSSPGPEGFMLIFDLFWLGLVYGTVDGLFLSVLPVFAIREALTELGWTKGRSGRTIVGLSSLAGSLAVIAIYHLGYPEFRGPQVIFPTVGVGVMSLAYVATGNPLSALISHVAMHLAAVLYGLESVKQLPPHY